MVKDFIEGLRIEIDVNETTLPKIALSDSILKMQRRYLRMMF